MNDILKHCGCSDCATRCGVCASILDGTARVVSHAVMEAASLVPDNFEAPRQSLNESYRQWGEDYPRRDFKWWEKA